MALRSSFEPVLAIQPAQATEARRLLRAACRRLEHLEHPSGYEAHHYGRELLEEAKQLIAAASEILATVEYP